MKKFILCLIVLFIMCVSIVFANINYQEPYIQIPQITSGKNYLSKLDNYNKQLELERKYNEYWQNGNRKFDLKNYKGAIDDYTQALKIKQSESLFINRGNAKFNRKDYSGAIDDYTCAININPRNEKAFLYRGNAKFNLKNYQGAILDYSIAISISPSAELYSNCGDAEMLLKDYTNAIKNYTQAINIKPRENDFLGRANAKLNIKDYKGAVDDYNQAILFNSNNDTTYLNRGDAKKLSGDYFGAITDYNTAANLNPQSSAKSELLTIVHSIPTHTKIKCLCFLLVLYFIWLSIQNSINETINRQFPSYDATINQEYSTLYSNLTINSQAPNIENYNLTHDDINQIPKYIDRIQKAQNIPIEDIWKLTACVAILVTWLFTNDLCSSVIPFWMQVIIISAVLYNPVKYIKIACCCRDIDNTTYTKAKIRNYFVYKGVKELYDKNIEPIRQVEEDRLWRIREAEERKLKRTIGFWQSYWEEKQQNGFEFEKAVGELYKQMGYKVSVTQGTGDGGVDIEIWKDGQKGIVQCKAHKHQVGPNDIRALWGVKDDFKADYVIFVAYAGVTSGAYDFTKGKRYTIIDKKDLLKMSVKANAEKYKV